MTRLIPLFLVVMTATAVAEDKPWETGVPRDKRDQANAIFTEANTLFAQQAHKPALEKYKEAIAIWDHPLIRFNMAVTLIRLDLFLEAAESIDAALRFGQGPFTEQDYGQALDYQKLVSGRIATIEATCSQAGVQVLLDGKPWLACPGTKSARVLAGEHALTGKPPTKDLQEETLPVILAPGKTLKHKVNLRRTDSFEVEYPTPRWIPWTVTGTGVAVALGGLAFWFAGRNQMDKFESDFAMMCPTGCQADLSDMPLLADARDSAQLKGKIAVSMMVAGSAISVGGVVWVIMNRPRRVLPKMEVSPTQGGMQAAVGWRF